MSMGEPRTGARRLIDGVLWNAAGRGLPLLLALALTPILLHQLGLERWGLFTLALAIVGVFSIFDLGIGSALNRALSERIGDGDTEDAAAVVSAALVVLTGIGAIGGLILWLLMPLLVERVLNVPPGLQDEAVTALRILAFAVPMVVYSSALWGVLAAYQRFRAANLVQIPINILYYLGPVLLLPVWDSLITVMLCLVFCRAANAVGYAAMVRPILPGISLRGLRLRLLLPVLRIGGWMSFSNMVGQSLLYADRFIIGSMLSLAAVAFYATPLDLVLRFAMAPVAVATSMMPVLASTYRNDPVQSTRTLRRGFLAILAVVVPACLLVVAGAEPLLRLWLGAELASGAWRVLQVLGFGILFHCACYAPGCMIEAIGRPDLLGRSLLLQAMVFLPLGVWLLTLFGIEGIAIAWALRCLADCLGRQVMAAWLYPPSRQTIRDTTMPLLIAAAGLLLLLPITSIATLVAVTLVVMLAFGFSLLWALDPVDRHWLLQRVGLARARGA